MSKADDKFKKTIKKCQVKKAKNNIYVMYGFKKNDIDKTAFLQIRKDGQHGKHGIYRIVKDEAEATRFLGAPLDKASLKSFGTPKQWAKFFNDEDELSEWSFHPIGISN